MSDPGREDRVIAGCIALAALVVAGPAFVNVVSYGAGFATRPISDFGVTVVVAQLFIGAFIGGVSGVAAYYRTGRYLSIVVGSVIAVIAVVAVCVALTMDWSVKGLS